MIRQREFLIRHRRHFALLAVVGALSFAVAAEHSGFNHTDDPGHEPGAVVISMCLAVLTATLAAPAIAGAWLSAGRATRPVRDLGSASLVWRIEPRPEPPRPRAGPELLQNFRR